MLPLNPILKDAFEKFEQDFLASNLPEGRYIKPLASTAKYYKLGQPCFIALIHPIQWTIANAVSADRPAKDVLCFHQPAGP